MPPLEKLYVESIVYNLQFGEERFRESNQLPGGTPLVSGIIC